MCGGDCGEGDGVCVKCILLNILKRKWNYSTLEWIKNEKWTKIVDESEKITYNIRREGGADMLVRFNVKNFLSFNTRDNGKSEEFSMIAGKVRSNGIFSSY